MCKRPSANVNMSWVNAPVNSPEAQMHIQAASLTLGMMVLAFENRHQWRHDQTVLLWLAGFIPAACAAEELTSRQS